MCVYLYLCAILLIKFTTTYQYPICSRDNMTSVQSHRYAVGLYVHTCMKVYNECGTLEKCHHEDVYSRY